VVAKSNYVIAVRSNADATDYIQDLVDAMDLLAPVVAASIDLDDDTRRSLLRSSSSSLRRRLVVEVELPTTLDGTIIDSCPDFIAETDRCEEVGASIGLLLDDENTAEARAAFEAALETAILDQELQSALDTVNSDSVVYIVTGIEVPDGGEGTDRQPADEGLSAGAISGLVIVGAVGLLFLSILLVRRRSNQQRSEYLKQNESVDLEEINGPASPDGRTLGAVGVAGGMGVTEGRTLIMSTSQTDDEPATLGAVAAVPRKSAPAKKKLSSKYSANKVYVPPGVSPSRDRERGGNDESSHAGSSGWSSQGGMSSLDTSSVDVEMIDDGGAGTTPKASLAGIGAASALASTVSEDASEPGIQMTYSELDQAIQKGDWAAVGVTAALLASQSFDSSRQSAGKSPRGNVSLNATINPTRAAELDRLVEAGDWEGVVAAAAKYDAQETLTSGGNESVSSRGSGSAPGSAGSPSGGGSLSSTIGSTAGGTSVLSGSALSGYSGSGTGRSAFTSSAGTSDANSRAKNLEDIRAEVEELVKHVVPEERDNVDEMLMQFRGREEELVETLRSMKERAVAQKARVEGQKRAKRDAKQIMEQKQQRALYSAVDNTGAPADENWMNEIDNTPNAGGGRLGIDQLEPPKEEDEDKEMREMQQALRDAISSENWDKVAEAASGLSGVASETISMGSTRSRSSTSTSRSDRTNEIDSLVDRGDWDGVVAAASRFQAADQTSVGAESAEDRATRRQRRLREEEEALAQADIWDAIAEQTRQEAMSSDAGAKVAADWAIARSLNALNSPRAGFGDRMYDDSEDEEGGNGNGNNASSGGGKDDMTREGSV